MQENLENIYIIGRRDIIHLCCHSRDSHSLDWPQFSFRFSVELSKYFLQNHVNCMQPKRTLNFWPFRESFFPRNFTKRLNRKILQTENFFLPTDNMFC